MKIQRIGRLTKIYLMAAGLVASILIFLVVLLGTKSFLYSGPTFSKALTNVGTKIEKDYPSIGALGTTLISAGGKIGKEDYFWREFNAAYWPTVGPKANQAFFEFVPDNVFANIVMVATVDQLSDALRNVKPGGIIVIKDGSYTFSGKRLTINNEAPTQEKQVYLVSETIGGVTLNLDSIEGLYINQPYWNVIGINFKGTCSVQARCEHAMHVVGAASHFRATHNSFIDFNAAIKVNRIGDSFPDNGTISNNHFYFNEPRQVRSSVTPINIDHGNNWAVTNNIIRDFEKTGGNTVSYGAFIKGGAVGGRITNNLVICRSKDSSARANLVGLSLGGGGMQDKRDNAEFETSGVVVANNIIMHCNDVGLYINKGENSLIYNNTLYNTSGLDLRFPQTSGLVFNNVVNGKIRFRDDSIATVENNIVETLDYWTGENPLQQVYRSPSNGNFAVEDPRLLESNQFARPLSTSLKNISKDFCNNALEDDLVAGAVQVDSKCF